MAQKVKNKVGIAKFKQKEKVEPLVHMIGFMFRSPRYRLIFNQNLTNPIRNYVFFFIISDTFYAH